jgi:hypothetical protein
MRSPNQPRPRALRSHLPRCARALVAAAAALLLGALLPAARAAAEGTLDGRLAEARDAYVKALERAASWASENQVLLERDATYALILRVAPDHARARAGLKYVREAKGGRWRQKDYVAPKNWNKGLVATAQKKRAEAFAPYRDAVLAALEDGAGPKPGKKAEVLEGLIDLAPDDPALREPRGDVERDGHWYLPETIDGIARREAFRALKKRVRAELPEPAADPAGKNWPGALTTGPFTVWSTKADEVRPYVVLMETAHRFLKGALPGEVKEKVGMRYILVQDRDTARKWLSEQGPEYADARRDVEHYGSIHLPTGSVLCYLKDPQWRRISCLRQVVSRIFDHSSRGDRDRGWILEGLEQRLCWHIDAAHGNPFGQTGHSDGPREDAGEGMPDTEADWIGAAARALTEDPVPRFRMLLTRRLNAMEVPDSLAAYALGAFLLEGRPESLGPLVKASMTMDDADKQAEAAFGVDATTLAWRVRRFAMETASLDR